MLIRAVGVDKAGEDLDEEGGLRLGALGTLPGDLLTTKSQVSHSCMTWTSILVVLLLLLLEQCNSSAGRSLAGTMVKSGTDLPALHHIWVEHLTCMDM